MERITHPIWTVRNVRTLFLGESISYFGDAFFNLAIVWAVYSATGSLFATSLIQVVWHVTDAVASPIAGVLADRHDRARIMVVTTFASAITLLLLTASIWMRGVQIVDALVAIVLVNFWTTFYRPARASALPDMVDAASYSSVQGAFSSTRLVADVVGTGLGGVMIATYGVVPAMGLNALSFALMGLALLRISLPQRSNPEHPVQEKHLSQFTRDLKEGWGVVWHHPIVRSMMLAAVLVNAVASLGMLYPGLVDQQLGGGAETLGLLGIVGPIAGIMAGIVIGRTDHHFGSGRLVAVGWLLAGGCTILVGLSHNLYLTLFVHALATLFLTLGSITGTSILETAIPPAFRGRGFGVVRALVVITIPPVTLLVGWAADSVGVGIMFVIGGAFQALAGAYVIGQRQLSGYRLDATES